MKVLKQDVSLTLINLAQRTKLEKTILVYKSFHGFDSAIRIWNRRINAIRRIVYRGYEIVLEMFKFDFKVSLNHFLDDGSL